MAQSRSALSSSGRGNVSVPLSAGLAGEPRWGSHLATVICCRSLLEEKAEGDRDSGWGEVSGLLRTRRIHRSWPPSAGPRRPGSLRARLTKIERGLRPAYALVCVAMV